ncbi:MAG: GH25 family lysozyme [Flavipsychrobacter sp.]
MKKSTIVALVISIVIFGGAFIYLKDKRQKADAVTTTTTTEKETPKAVSGTYYGIDVSHWNGNIVEDINKMDDLSFGICKATQGVGYIDPDFDTNWKALRQKGLIRGAYHFYKTNKEPVEQAQYYYQQLKGHSDDRQMTFIVDIEAGSLSGNETASDVEKVLLSFLKELETLSGKTPMVYTNYAFANQYLTNATLAKYPLWLAEYSGQASPSIPAAWQQDGYTIWQKTDTHDLNSSKVDYDEYNGVLGALNVFGE